MRWLVGEILQTQVHVVLWLLVLWSALGTLAGAGLGTLVHVGAARAGAWRMEWRHGRWLRGLTAAWLVAGFASIGTLVGFAEGSLRSVERVVRESQFRRELLDRAGDLGALGVAWIDLYIARWEGTTSDADAEAQWGAFAEGTGELNARAFLARLDRAPGSLRVEAVAAARARLRRLEGWGGGLLERLVDLGLGMVVHPRTREAAAYVLSRDGADAVGFFTTLEAAAAAAGPPETLTRADLARHVVERALIPNILGPARLFARSQQVTAVPLLALVALLPVLMFVLARALEGRMRPSGGEPGALEAPGGQQP